MIGENTGDVNSSYDKMMVDRILTLVHSALDAKETALSNAAAAHDLLSEQYGQSQLEVEDREHEILMLEFALEKERETSTAKATNLQSKLASQGLNPVCTIDTA